jgi:hypothetical protein
VDSLDLKSLLNFKIGFVLLSVVVVNLVVFAFLWRLDGFVHGDLYSFGLVFSYNWANEYWSYNWMVWAFLVGASVLAAVSIVPQYMRRRAPGRYSKYATFFEYAAIFLPVVAVICQALAVVKLDQINNLVWSGLYAYGVRGDIDWSVTYNLISMPALALMVVALLALIITVIATLNIIEIQIVREDESSDVENIEDIEKADETQETVKPTSKEEEANLTTSIQSPIMQADSTGKPAAEENRPENAAAEVSLEHRIVKKRKRGRRKRRRKSLSMAPSLEPTPLVTLKDIEETGRRQETAQLLKREETEPKSSTSSIPTKETDNSVKPASEEKKLDILQREASVAQKAAKRRRRRRRKKARGSRAKTRLNTTKKGA